ncbi:related to nucleoside diphosphate-sugar hydrolase of the MutT (NUDIX) family [Phialocephala subalpina]|uniref:Related to nucleoside diphosphate-sugar hydrolase of the MutT (NUDIX) family n=1 Tax=Phialocephala subalpina TaxID=576137 RepID=A0A1L7XE24_9HELO|nr:related to nucleoside diphosphate-sugar hydrolase of the MutT (NUDIX) family [Phialocephala subalpina]
MPPVTRSMSNTPGFNLDWFTPPVPVRFETNKISKDELLSFKPFKDWAGTLKSSLELQRTDTKHPFNKSPYSVRSVTIQSADKFGPTRVGFVKLAAEIMNEAKPKPESLPGVAFLRGGSVAMLMILRPSDSNTERWVIMTEQPRIPAGSLRFLEIPAGMIDSNQTFAGVAAKEIKEETGLVIHESELKDLTELALKGTGGQEDLQAAMYPSPGGSDEFIAIFLWEKVLDRQEIEDLRGKLTGLRTQGEKITVRILDYEQLWRVGARDAKTLAAWSLYEALKRARHPALIDSRSW